MAEWYRVEVSDHDGQIVAIEPAMLAGRDIGDRERTTIRNAIEQLQGFIGLGPVLMENPGTNDSESRPHADRTRAWSNRGVGVRGLGSVNNQLSAPIEHVSDASTAALKAEGTPRGSSPGLREHRRR